MKSHALKDVVIGLYRCILLDQRHIDPVLLAELHSVKRLQSLVESNGLAIFTIVMPDLCKFLERGLSIGRLDAERPRLGGRKSSTDARPTFLWGYWSLIFDEQGVLRPLPSTAAIAGLRQLLLFAKKLRLECSEERTNGALLDFLQTDEELPRSWDRTWDDDTPDWEPRRGHPLWGDTSLYGREPDLFGAGSPVREPEVRTLEWDTLRDISRLVLQSFGPLTVYDLVPKHGPGAVSDNVRDKWTLPHWPRKLGSIFPADWFASTDFVDRTVSCREFPSRVLCVPKTQKGPRIIAAEPTSHQYCQGAIERWLRNGIGQSLIRESIDLRDQTRSQRMALEASLTGAFATVDLSAASDRLSTRLVEYVFQYRRDVLDALHACRTRTFQMPDGSIHIARKFACMGSACTFPVQTIVFTIFAIWSVLESRGEPVTKLTVRDASQWVRVFGDDIILPIEAYDHLVDALTSAGLKVNTSKSFAVGNFRESCGMDAYGGDDVTPAYLLEPYDLSNPESLVSVVACSNNFHRKGLWAAAAFLLNTVDPKVRKRLRIAGRDVSQPCVLSFAPSEDHLDVRFNPESQALEVRALVVDVRADVRDHGWEADLLQFFSSRGENPLLDEVMENRGPERILGQVLRPKTRLSLRWVLMEDRGA